MKDLLKAITSMTIVVCLCTTCLIATMCAPSPHPNHEWEPRDWESCDHRCEAAISTDAGLVSCECWCDDEGREMYVCDEEVVGVAELEE